MRCLWARPRTRRWWRSCRASRCGKRLRRRRGELRWPDEACCCCCGSQDVADEFHDVDFVWDDKWLRWYVDDVLLQEEFIQSGSSGSGDVVVELGVGGRTATLAVERVTLSSGSTSDPFCAPRYPTSSNCRAQECTFGGCSVCGP
jgi:hypothetical protein